MHAYNKNVSYYKHKNRKTKEDFRQENMGWDIGP